MYGIANHRVIAFHVEKDSDLAKNLEFIQSLKHGSLFKHKHIKQYWYLDGDGKYMHRIRNHQYNLLMDWNERSINLSDSQKKILKSIGATEAEGYGNKRGRIKIPVSIILNSGKTMDPGLVQISKEPPFLYEEKTIILGDEVKEIEPTGFALSQEIRTASHSVKELRMGFAPTLVETKDREPYILNWSMDIFKYGNIAGSDVILSDNKFNFEIVAPIVGSNDMKYCLFHYDWFEGCESLLIRKG